MTTSDAWIEFDGRRVALDAEGHLANPADWSPAVAVALAERDGVGLGDDHWWLIEFVRDHYHRYGTVPLMRQAIMAWRRASGDDTIGSRELYRLLPDGPIRLACRYAGLPAPESCI